MVSLGRNIFTGGSRVHLGDLMAQYGGGGHAGAASCSFPVAESEINLENIISVLEEN